MTNAATGAAVAAAGATAAAAGATVAAAAENKPKVAAVRVTTASFL